LDAIIGLSYDALPDDATRSDDAIDHYQQSLEICQRIGDVAGVALTYWNLGLLYEEQGDLPTALPLLEHYVQWEEQIGHPNVLAHRTRVDAVQARLNDQ
jgi:tetratricopeptide (TPR) repeat protein